MTIRGGSANSEKSSSPLPHDRLWTQKEAAYFCGVSARYLRESSCPKLLLPGHGARGKPLVRYEPESVIEWATAWRTGRDSENPNLTRVA